MPKSQLEHAPNIATLLKGTAFEATDVRRIHVGTTNFAYRIFLKTPLEGGERTAILKYSAPLTATEPRVPFSPNRQAFEVNALANIPWHEFTYPIVPQLAPQSQAIVKLPKLYLSVPDLDFCIIEDCTPRPQATVWDQYAHSFREFLEDQPPSREKYEAASSLGTMLGSFLAQLHTWGLHRSDHSTAFALFSKNIYAKELMTKELFDNFRQNIKQLGYIVSAHQQAQLQERLTQVNESLNSETQSVAMGDFWMGNVLINLDDKQRLRDIYVIDWEFVNMAPTWLDVGNFVGELFLIGYFEGTDDAYIHVLEAFITAYRGCGLPLDTSRALQFAGAHIMMSLPRRVTSKRSKATFETALPYVETSLKLITDPEFNYLLGKESDPLMTIARLLRNARQPSTTQDG
ncbi:hypothetical protein COCMIDRAFT_4838 [Bipolaris oryzae ATCC 44560]|uniref:Aminoglycoside phosphotransferase domain-containing protein n=1 Tax=Bipolaris oryzae ATCC 44560 TaxID=930090 RepID=W6Z876_COCMI|nr:uncharacterized protein COCMIDRAFT_4838 [Bipolaris oryzae ATCC 44560]EUC45993.1 hypothetical protein COCMIDRAFT_4838 [Bipolaris oryzae ATCC 44560]